MKQSNLNHKVWLLGVLVFFLLSVLVFNHLESSTPPVPDARSRVVFQRPNVGDMKELKRIEGLLKVGSNQTEVLKLLREEKFDFQTWPKDKVLSANHWPKQGCLNDYGCAPRVLVVKIKFANGLLASRRLKFGVGVDFVG